MSFSSGVFYNISSKNSLKKIKKLENNSFSKQMAKIIETDLQHYENIRINRS